MKQLLVQAARQDTILQLLGLLPVLPAVRQDTIHLREQARAPLVLEDIIRVHLLCPAAPVAAQVPQQPYLESNLVCAQLWAHSSIHQIIRQIITTMIHVYLKFLPMALLLLFRSVLTGAII